MADATHQQSWIGLDLGMAAEPTALCAVTRDFLDPRDPSASPGYRLDYLHRYPPGTPFAEVAEGVFALKQREEFRLTPTLVDVGGVGRAVARLVFERLKGRLEGNYIPVRMVAGPGLPGQDADHSLAIPFVEVVGTFQVLLQTRRLAISPSLPLASTLAAELSAFRMRPRPKPSDGDPWRERADDDLLFAVGIALWTGEQVLDHERRVLREQAREAERVRQREWERQAQIDRFVRMRGGWGW